ncbi:hypothetical protein [Nostoc sp. 'Lobaria pulmonaria (5183) cyanobiont']|uniref:hypothetical protein n=1 Tax=Nostoc sp. 'Lobaria pulmonaria (5183) cyanobiont' TaxID=1618022 RepID=UPI000CF317F0
MIEFGQSFTEVGELLIEFGELLIEFGESLIEFGESLIEFGESLIEFGESFTEFGESFTELGATFLGRRRIEFRQVLQVVVHEGWRKMLDWHSQRGLIFLQLGLRKIERLCY